MSETTKIHSSFRTSGDDRIVEYRAVSGLAIVGLLLGLASPLAMWRLLLLGVPAAAIFVCLLALSRIRDSGGHLFGRRIAVLGLCLAIFFAAAAPARTATKSYLIAGQARPLADQFFKLLTTNEPRKALQLTKLPSSRQPFDAQLWDYYRTDADARQGLKKFVKMPLVRSLLALGDKAQVRFYENGVVKSITHGLDTAALTYAVTFDKAEQKTSFFVVIVLERKSQYKDGVPRWRVVTFEVLNKPPPTG